MKLIKLATLASSLLAYTAALGQVATVHTTGLTTPNKIVKGPDNSLIVSEAGTTTANSGRISIVDRTSGMRHTLVSGLPSAVSFLGGPAGDPDGPSGLALRGNRLLVTIGIGDAVVPGAGQGLETPNLTPSSPIFNSILELTLPGGFATLDSGFVLTLANQTTLDGGDAVTLTNSEGRTLTIRLVSDLPDWRPNPTPTVPTNVKASHLYGIETFQKSAYVVDAGHNEIKIVDLGSGAASTFIAFPVRPNPTPMGPPFIEAVPTNIHRFGNQFLVSLLTGFPFAMNVAEIRRVSFKGFDDSFITGLTTAMDVVKVGDDEDKLASGDESLLGTAKGGGLITAKDSVEISDDSLTPGDGNSYYTLEFSTNLLGGAPGRLRFYKDPGSIPVNVLTNLVSPNSMALDNETGNLFITNIRPGTITKVSFP
jgi:hypothetical protein